MTEDTKDHRLSKEEYNAKYMNEEYVHNKHNKFDSIQVENFLSDEELLAFDIASKSDDISYHNDTGMNKEVEMYYGRQTETTAHYNIFANFYTNPAWSHLVDIIQPKLETHLGNGIYASHIHVLESQVPYGIHTDAQQPNMILAPTPAWTLIIPLDDVDSRTYQFNQRTSYKLPWDWIHAENIQPSDEYSISRELWEQDFAPLTDYEIFRYLSIESVFQWKKGSLFAADRYRFHCSDNYYNRGIKQKKAIIAWTSII